MAEDLCYVNMFIILHAWLTEHIYAGNIPACKRIQYSVHATTTQFAVQLFQLNITKYSRCLGCC